MGERASGRAAALTPARARFTQPPSSPPPKTTTPPGTVRCDVEKDAFVAHYRALQASYDQRVASGQAAGGKDPPARWRPPPPDDAKPV